MITVIVSYTVKPSFVEENKKNIRHFLQDFKNLNSDEFQYNVYLKEDGVTFLHQSTYLNENIQTIVLNLPSFRRFQMNRDEQGMSVAHKVEVLTLLGASSDIFQMKTA